MKLINHTSYDTATLRKVVRLVAAEELNPKERKWMTVEFFHKHAKGIRAARNYRYHHATVGIYKWDTDFAWTATLLAHEFAEQRGKRHRDMYGCTRYGYGKPRGAYWAARMKEAGIHRTPTRVMPSST